MSDNVVESRAEQVSPSGKFSSPVFTDSEARMPERRSELCNKYLTLVRDSGNRIDAKSHRQALESALFIWFGN